ncbi:MAG: hypothetical protein H7A25_04745 [Leptospiraceae bacterium]|nr:hypothetical protein [Leptospiraceae bacterium]MCP5499185.1 hypothetical protein [Leptospiraceae bacterium]
MSEKKCLDMTWIYYILIQKDLNIRKIARWLFMLKVKTFFLIVVLYSLSSVPIYSQDKNQSQIRAEKKVQIGLMAFNRNFFSFFAFNLNSKFSAGVSLSGSRSKKHFDVNSTVITNPIGTIGIFQKIENKDTTFGRAGLFLRWYPFENGFFISMSTGISKYSKRSEKLSYTFDNSIPMTYLKYTNNLSNRVDAGLGLGYQHIFSSGFFIDAGLEPFIMSKTKSNIYITDLYSSSSINPLVNYYTTKTSLRREFQDSSRGINFHFNVGIAF